MNEAGVAPPGVMPIQQPIAVERRNTFQCFGISPQVCHTTFGLMRALLPLKAEGPLHRQQDLADAEQADHGDQGSRSP